MADFAKMSAFLDSLVAMGVPGVGCAIHRDGKEIYRYTPGYADIASKRPVDGKTQFFLYSTSKVITCVAALTLWEEGKYLMDDPIGLYFPEFAEMTVREMLPNTESFVRPAKKQILVKDLFTMSAGLDYWLESPEILAIVAEKPHATLHEIMVAISKRPLNFDPGEHFCYSLCHDLLGAMIEIWSGMTFGEYLKKRIFAPLGMDDTAFATAATPPKNLATLYRMDENGNKFPEAEQRDVYCITDCYESGGAGLYSTLDDYLKFLDALVAGKIISKATLDMMRTNMLDEQRMKDFTWPQMAGYGYGYGVRTLINRNHGASSPIGECGWGGAAGAQMVIDPDNRLTLFYTQHMLNNMEAYISPRLRNILYGCLD